MNLGSNPFARSRRAVKTIAAIFCIVSTLALATPLATAQSMGYVQGDSSTSPGSDLQVYVADCPYYVEFTITWYDNDGYTRQTGASASSWANYDTSSGLHWVNFSIPSNYYNYGSFWAYARCVDESGALWGDYGQLQIPVSGGSSGYADSGSASTGSGGSYSTGYAGTIYITIDDGPNPYYTPQVLDVLSRHGAQATFFTIGQNVQAYPGLAAEIVNRGHAIANHSWSHPDMRYLSYDGQAAQIAETSWAIYNTTGYNPSCFRPPYGAANSNTYAAVSNAGLNNYFWTVDTNDWRQPGSQAIANSIVSGAYDGAVVLIHDGGGNRAGTVAGLDSALAYLSAQGYQFRALPGC